MHKPQIKRLSTSAPPPMPQPPNPDWPSVPQTLEVPQNPWKNMQGLGYMFWTAAFGGWVWGLGGSVSFSLRGWAPCDLLYGSRQLLITASPRSCLGSQVDLAKAPFSGYRVSWGDGLTEPSVLNSRVLRGLRVWGVLLGVRKKSRNFIHLKGSGV